MPLNPEAIEQIKVHEWVKQNTDLPFLHIANEGKRSYVNGSILKRMGMKPGVSDIFIPRSTKEHHGLWIELKTGYNKPTNHQLQFIDDMKKEGYEAITCWGADATIEKIRDFYHSLTTVVNS